MTELEKVEQELARYEHPLFEWSAEEVQGGVEVSVRLKFEGIADPYRFLISKRELNDQGFPWAFQRQFFNYLHDYIVEMFIRTPQIW
ncbi:MAG: hypothetical protein AB1489_11730 [Acidobacteriota bacterium]